MITTGISSHVRYLMEETGVRLLSSSLLSCEDLYLKHPCDGLFFFSTSVANETEILNIWFKLNQTITNIVKVSVAGTSLKKVRKKFRNRRAGKTTMSKLKKAMIVSSGHGGINFLNDYDEADEVERQ